MTNFATVIGRARRRGAGPPPLEGFPPPAASLNADAPTSAGLAMPKGPSVTQLFSGTAQIGQAQAGDFFDSGGVCHHPNNSNTANDPASVIATCRDLGIRHIRYGQFSPADYGGSWEPVVAQNLSVALKNNLASLPAGAQPLFALLGTTEEPIYEQNRGSATYTVTTTNGTFLRPFDGPPGTVSDRFGTSPYNGIAGVRLENAGTYQDIGWSIVAGLQGPNEPDARACIWQGAGSVLGVLGDLKTAKNARTNKTVLGGLPYVNSATGRITTGTLNASRIPVVGPHLIGNNWSSFGTAAQVGPNIDAGNRHTYWGGHGPKWVDLVNDWNGSTSYSTTGPRFCTEHGYITRPGSDTGSGQRFVPPEVGGEYLLRDKITNYLIGVRRSYIHSLSEEVGPAYNGDQNVAFGLVTYNYTPRACYYAIKNMQTLVGFVQPANPSPLNVSVTGWSPSSRQTISDGFWFDDHLNILVLQRSDKEYLIIFVREREIWDRGLQQYLNTDTKNLTITLPSNTIALAGVAEPAKNPIKDPVDGIQYANPGNGAIYYPLTVSGGNSVSLAIGGLTRVVSLTLN